MEQYFYLDAEGRQQGPVSGEALPRYGVTRNTQVWSKGMTEWAPAGSVAELDSVFPPLTPASATPVQQTPQQRKPDSGLVWSILTTILCCLPTGIVAIVYSSKVDGLWYANDYEGAHRAAKTARTWNIVGVVVAVVAWAIYAVFFASIFAAAVSSASAFDYM